MKVKIAPCWGRRGPLERLLHPSLERWPLPAFEITAKFTLGAYARKISRVGTGVRSRVKRSKPQDRRKE